MFQSMDLALKVCQFLIVSQGSVPGPLLFLLYINNLHTAIKFCKVYHFADISKSIKKVNKFVNST